MANDLYWDPVNGNNANNGSSWALAVQTPSGATAAKGLAAGHTLFVTKSPDPTSLGVTATFVDQQQYITIQGGSYPFLNITLCESNWTASATGVACATDSTNYKQGTVACKTTLAASPATSTLQSYFNTGTLNLSSYQQLSGWIKLSAAVTTNTKLNLTLCSGTNGTGTPTSFAIPVFPTHGVWIPFCINSGGALPSSIQSVAIFSGTVAPPGNLVITLDALVACLAPANAASISLVSLVSQTSAAQSDPYVDGTDGAWYPVRYLDSSTGQIGIDNVSTTNYSASFTGWTGTGATVSIYKREPLQLFNVLSSALAAFTPLGSTGSYVTISGGWNTSNSTQDGDTFIDYMGQNFIPIYFNNQPSWVTVSRLSFVRNIYQYGMELDGCAQMPIQYCRAIGCVAGIWLNFSYAAALSNCSFMCGQFGLYSVTSTATTLTNCVIGSMMNDAIYAADSSDFITGNNVIVRNNAVALYQGGASIWSFEGMQLIKNTLNYNMSGESITLQDGSLTTSTAPTFPLIGLFYNPMVYSGAEGIVYSDYVTWTQTTLAGFSGNVVQCQPTNAARSVSYPANLIIASIPCEANVAVTVSVSMQRTNTGITGGIFIAGGQLAGVGTTISANMSATANTKQTVTLPSFTPTASGWVNVTFQCYGGTTYSCYVGEISTSPMLPASTRNTLAQFGMMRAGRASATPLIAAPRAISSQT